MPVIQPGLRLLQEFADLEEDWDSYGARPISTAAIEIARRLIVTVAGECAILYAVAPVADGGVYIEWRGPGGQLEVWVRGRGGLGYLLVSGNRVRIEQMEATRQQVMDALAAIGASATEAQT